MCAETETRKTEGRCPAPVVDGAPTPPLARCNLGLLHEGGQVGGEEAKHGIVHIERRRVVALVLEQVRRLAEERIHACCSVAYQSHTRVRPT